MKVLILNNDFRVYWKGRLLFLRKYLAVHGIDLHAVELFGSGSPYAFDTYNNQEQWWTCLFPANSAEELTAKQIADKLFAFADQLNADVVIGPSIVFYAGALGLRWARQRKRRFIMFDDGKTSQIRRNPVVQFVKDLLIGQSDALWLPTDKYDKEYTDKHRWDLLFCYGFDSVDNELFKLDQERTFDHNAIICVARLVPVKNLDRLLRAWVMVEQKHPDAKLLLIGDGSEEEKLKRLQTSLDLKGVQFLGALDNNQIPVWYYRADALILASTWESWGLVVNEGMAAGLPVLLSKTVNAGESLLEEGVNGYSFDPLDVDSIAAAITRYLNLDAHQKKAMSARSLSIIDGMSYDNMGRQLLGVLLKLQDRKPRRPGLLATLIMNSWSGKYNVGAWDKQAPL